MQVAMISALCSPTGCMLILSWSVVVVAGVACCCCILLQFALMLILTFASYTLTCDYSKEQVLFLFTRQCQMYVKHRLSKI